MAQEYLILYKDDNYETVVYKQPYATCAGDALLGLYRYVGGSCNFTDEELKKVFETFGFKKLLQLFQREHYEILAIGTFEALYCGKNWEKKDD